MSIFIHDTISVVLGTGDGIGYSQPKSVASDNKDGWFVIYIEQGRSVSTKASVAITPYRALKTVYFHVLRKTCFRILGKVHKGPYWTLLKIRNTQKKQTVSTKKHQKRENRPFLTLYEV